MSQQSLMDLLSGGNKEKEELTPECAEGCQEEGQEDNKINTSSVPSKVAPAKEEIIEFDNQWVVSYMGVKEKFVRDLALTEYTEKALLKALSKDFVALTIADRKKVSCKYDQKKKLILVIIQADRKGS